MTLFKGLTIDQIHRMQFDIETNFEPGTFPRADREGDEIIILSITDNRGYQCVLHTGDETYGHDYETRCRDERDLLQRFVQIVHRLNPDVLEGHNVFGFDLPYIATRCDMLEVNLAIGRDSRKPWSYHAEKQFAERDFTYENFLVAGRAVIDTMFMAIDWDVVKRKLPGYGLKVVAQTLDVAPADREYVEGEKIPQIWREEPGRLIRYALHDVEETEGIARKMMASTFYMTQMLPLSYQAVHLKGSAAKIQTLFVREYMRQGHSLPKAEYDEEYPSQKFGGFTECFQSGVYDDVIYADVSSLYPSIMLTYDIQPASDHLKLFPYFLRKLTDLRLDAKGKLAAFKKGTMEYDEMDGRQSLYKIIINSFYGAAGAGVKFMFSDVREADRVAETGQALLHRMIELIRHRGGDPVLCDTDGCIFLKPDYVTSEADAKALVVWISERMPDGIDIDLEGYFPRIAAFRKKTYALLDAEGSMTTKGGSLKSRGLEPFLAAYLQRQLTNLMMRDVEEMHRIHEDTKLDIVTGKYTGNQLAKAATLKKSLKQYDQDVQMGGPRAAQYEIGKKLRKGGKDIGKGDKIRWVVGGNKSISKVSGYADAIPLDEWTTGAENKLWYLKRVVTTAKRFEVFFTEGDFGLVFSKRKPEFTMDLFAGQSGTVFDVSTIEITNVRNEV